MIVDIDKAKQEYDDAFQNCNKNPKDSFYLNELFLARERLIKAEKEQIK